MRLHCFIVLLNVKGVKIFNILDSTCTYTYIANLALHWVEIDMDLDPDRQALDADPNSVN